MIKVQILVNGEKIRTDYDEENITLTESSLLVRELENIKLEHLNKDFVKDLIKYDSGGDDE